MLLNVLINHRLVAKRINTRDLLHPTLPRDTPTTSWSTRELPTRGLKRDTCSGKNRKGTGWMESSPRSGGTVCRDPTPTPFGSKWRWRPPVGRLYLGKSPTETQTAPGS